MSPAKASPNHAVLELNKIGRQFGSDPPIQALIDAHDLQGGDLVLIDNQVPIDVLVADLVATQRSPESQRRVAPTLSASSSAACVSPSDSRWTASRYACRDKRDAAPELLAEFPVSL